MLPDNNTHIYFSDLGATNAPALNVSGPAHELASQE
jgi:hypothetical protein